MVESMTRYEELQKKKNLIVGAYKRSKAVVWLKKLDEIDTIIYNLTVEEAERIVK